MKCTSCANDDSKYKCSRCRVAYYCSAPCCKLHFAHCTIQKPDQQVITTEAQVCEDGEIESAVTPSRFAVLKRDERIMAWMRENAATGLLKQMLSAPDPILAVQKQRKSNKSFNDIALHILRLLEVK